MDAYNFNELSLEPTSKVKANAKQASPASTLNSTSSGDSANGAERVLIIVEVAGGDSDARGFRIKREHTINTILKGASKNFSVDPTKYGLDWILYLIISLLMAI